mgnify:FL=1
MKIVALGGGEIGRPGYPVETLEIDKEIVGLAGKKSPKLLFIPTASSDSENYVKVVKKHFGGRLGCQVDALYLLGKKLTEEQIKKKVFGSDIVYVGGGNTLKMMKVWRKVGLDQILKTAGEKGIVLSGNSAGAICWFRHGSSDSRRFTNSEAGLIRVTGLGFIPALFCPHYNAEKDREEDLRQLMKKTPGVGIGMDNCCAIEIVDNRYRIISSKKSANAYKVFWKKGKYNKELIVKKTKFTPLSNLLRK